MKLLLGLGIVITCVILGYVFGGGRLSVLWQPAEFLIILGAAFGAYIIANPHHVVLRTPSAILGCLKGPRYKKEHYLELLTLLFGIFKVIKTKGTIVLDEHLEKPKESLWFQNFPLFSQNTYNISFLCDYLRMIVMGVDSPEQMDILMQGEIEVFSHEEYEISQALAVVADGMPALGIVAAVLGVIHTMGAIDQPPEVLGQMIGGALVGTFLGVLLSYGVIGPLSQSIRAICESDLHYVKCMRACLTSFLNDSAPIVAVENGRKILPDIYRPDFLELEQACKEIMQKGFLK